MGWGHPSNMRNPLLLLFGVALLVVLTLVALRSGFWFFIFFFWGGPALFRVIRHSAGWEDVTSKRKYSDFVKAKNEDLPHAAEPVDYITAKDGEVLEVIEDRPARRYNDLI